MGAPSLPGFSLDRTFFGIEPSDRLRIHEMIFDLIWWGQGRWDWNTIYNMPIFLRTFWIKKVNEKLNPPDTAPKPDKKTDKKQDKISRPPKPVSKPKL
jgi:hypothetical protein